MDWRYSPGGADIARAVHLDLTHFLLSYVLARFHVLISCFFTENSGGHLVLTNPPLGGMIVGTCLRLYPTTRYSTTVEAVCKARICRPADDGVLPVLIISKVEHTMATLRVLYRTEF